MALQFLRKILGPDNSSTVKIARVSITLTSAASDRCTAPTVYTVNDSDVKATSLVLAQYTPRNQFDGNGYVIEASDDYELDPLIINVVEVGNGYFKIAIVSATPTQLTGVRTITYQVQN